MTPAERETLIARYAQGPAVLRAALAAVPANALKWRPAPGKWSVHEIVVHCGDSEVNAYMRLRYLLGEDRPTIAPYDQDRWARDLDYHALPLEPALAAAVAVRENTTPLLRRLTEAQWTRIGHHPEHQSYGVERWLQIYGEHLDVHARQIARNVEAWSKRSS